MSAVETDVDAWATVVVRANGPDLLRYLTRRAPDDAHDLLSETLAIIWQRRARLPRDEEAARMWSFGVARNMLRTHRRKRTQQTALLDSLRGENPSTGCDPAVVSDERARHARVHEALATLRRVDRELITLVHWDGFSIVDAASLLVINPSTARTRYARAKNRLAATLGDDERVSGT